MTHSTVFLPWASDNPCPHRRAALNWTVTRWRRAGRQVLIGQASGPWKTAAVTNCWTPGLDEEQVQQWIASASRRWRRGLRDAEAEAQDGLRMGPPPFAQAAVAC